MSARLRRTVALTLAALAVGVVLVWSASTGPSGLAEGVPQRAGAGDVVDQAGDQAEQASEEPEPTDTDQGRRLGDGLTWLYDVVGIAAFIALFWLATVVLRALARLVGDAQEQDASVDLSPLPDVEAAREAVGRRRQLHLEALEGSDVRDAIVACWVLLEQDAEAVGVRRQEAETPTEFVVRFLRTLDVDPRPVGRLAELYREARFSSHAMGEVAREQARAAVVQVHAELEGAGVA